MIDVYVCNDVGCALVVTAGVVSSCVGVVGVVGVGDGVFVFCCRWCAW